MMGLGEKIKAARLEAGLSQRQLCGDTVTRNMLSLIENGAARPSMDTLRVFAARLGKTVSYFLEEDAVVSPNQQVMAEARRAWKENRPESVLEVLKTYREPDELFQSERKLLESLATLTLAEDAGKQGRDVYARQLLEELEIGPQDYCARELQRRRKLLLGELAPEKLAKICRELPELDEELLLRAKDALNRGDAQRSEQPLCLHKRRLRYVGELHIFAQTSLQHICAQSAMIRTYIRKGYAPAAQLRDLFKTRIQRNSCPRHQSMESFSLRERLG
jgi:transcriptional regulator with XRE-family HTH domain